MAALMTLSGKPAIPVGLFADSILQGERGERDSVSREPRWNPRSRFESGRSQCDRAEWQLRVRVLVEVVNIKVIDSPYAVCQRGLHRDGAGWGIRPRSFD